MTDRFELNIVVVGALSTNCYLLMNKETGSLVIVDPGAGAEQIRSTILSMDGIPEAILLTHGHHDHLMAAGKLRDAFPGIVLCAPKKEEALLTMPSMIFRGVPEDFCGTIDQWVQEGDVLSFAGTSLRVLETPGHTAGSVCYYDEEEQLLFSGDTLFAGGCGRTDLPTGDGTAIMESLVRLAKEIPDETAVLPGHEELSTMQQEKHTNPYIR